MSPSYSNRNPTAHIASRWQPDEIATRSLYQSRPDGSRPDHLPHRDPTHLPHSTESGSGQHKSEHHSRSRPDPIEDRDPISSGTDYKFKLPLADFLHNIQHILINLKHIHDQTAQNSEISAFGNEDQTAKPQETKPPPDTKLQTSKQPLPDTKLQTSKQPLPDTKLQTSKQPLPDTKKSPKPHPTAKNKKSTHQEKRYLPQLSISSFKIICVIIDLFKLL
ncbi:hypothetical protein L2E82_04516 [Cichorium intybus]|uniref:Uncharacterized protein n=1 Tax=Cichorium intybus TaxID=13427 RepID=A0ACB9H6M8_CICIN|nr:hypothetical protein L2E82_04516 [Cichorium intybus]